MHTFFINTSKKELNEYDVLFDIQYEKKTLVSMECPMSDWYNGDKGYMACVKQMSDMIDGYVELNNAFNLIIYIDLSENKAYSSIQRDAFHDKDRDECCRAMHILFTHVITESIVDELVSSGRRPQNVLIMFGEEKHFTDFNVASNDTNRQSIMKNLFRFIGLPGNDVIEATAKKIDGTEASDKVIMFTEELSKSYGEELVPGIRERYKADLQLWCDAIINEANIHKANEELFERINGINKVESDRIGVDIVSCPYDFYACKVNKSILALSQLNIALYLLKCVENESVYETDSVEGTRKPIEFHLYSVQEIAPIFKSKESIYSAKSAEIETLAKSYTDLKLAPQLSSFDHAKFGLDMYGDKATDFIISDVQSEEADEEKEQNAAETSDDTDETIEIKGNVKEVTVVEKEGRKLFSRDEYKEFDYNFDQGSDKMLKKKTPPEEYIEQAKKVRKHHVDYLKKLKVHVSGVLSNYAGKSKENKPALLQMGGYRYAGPGEEDKVIETVEGVSNKAYESMINQYMEFCAGRSVAISDIEEQCNWFISRVHQIKESLRKIKLVAIGILFAILLLYVPFVVIQFEAIVENVLTLATALGSIAIPIVLLYFIFSIVALAQRKKYIKAWKEFKEKSDQALEENKIAAQKYDQLLSVIVPALRWVYEYKLDVDYCLECCSVADAKIEHHRRKLRDRVTSLQNILGDLEFKDNEHEKPQSESVFNADAIDYNIAFCSGEKNQSFYSVIDKKFFTKKNND